MASSDRLAWRPAPARLGLCAALFAAVMGVSGCVNAIPEASTARLVPTAPKPGVATPAETEEAVAAIENGSGPRRSDVKIAAREAKQARESGTISGSAAIDRMIEAHARENDIPPALAYAVVRVESRYNPKARGGSAFGLSQIKPATARSLGFSGPSSGLYDADTNLTYGMKYLKGAWEKSGHDVCRTAMKYKGGHRATRMTSSALSYCSAVKAHMAEIVKRRRAPGSEGTQIAAVAPKEAGKSAVAGEKASAPMLALAGQEKPRTLLAVLAAPSPRPEAEPAKVAEKATVDDAAAEKSLAVSTPKGGRLVATADDEAESAIDQRMADAFAN